MADELRLVSPVLVPVAVRRIGGTATGPPPVRRPPERIPGGRWRSGGSVLPRRGRGPARGELAASHSPFGC
ncbi:hypothetical protein [Streptomyces sp. IBSBF 2435]|uniref:hypothetical protein n=1 Tax=Streptomyces sp. IBSBF 2435 TaxID=2903531 RepID=UPI002FDB9F53